MKKIFKKIIIFLYKNRIKKYGMNVIVNEEKYNLYTNDKKMADTIIRRDISSAIFNKVVEDNMIEIKKQKLKDNSIAYNATITIIK